jgi:hypothetical protein
MRSLTLITVAATLVASCAPHAKPTCETRPDGLRLFVGENAEAYGDIIGALRSDPDRMEALARSTNVNASTTSGPAICKTDHAFQRSVRFVYPPRKADQVGATLDLYFGAKGRVEVAEFYVIPLAP